MINFFKEYGQEIMFFGIMGIILFFQIIGEMQYQHQEEVRKQAEVVQPYKDALYEANQGIKDAKDQAGNSYEEMNDVLNELEEVEP